MKYEVLCKATLLMDLATSSTLICKALNNIIQTVDLILFYNGRNSLESPQAHDPALGGYFIQIKITSSMKVPCRCKHAPRHLGANAWSF
jgi:hypothetical protein